MAAPASPYTVTLKAAAERDLSRLSADVRRRMVDGMARLGANPRPTGIKRLAGGGTVYRLRVGHYRILYEIDDAARVVWVSHVLHRGDAYR